MKKLFTFLVFAMVLSTTSCGKINDELDSLDERLNQLELSVIPSIDKQIDSINTSLDALEKADEELGQYIVNLEGTAKSLQEQITATNTALNEVEKSLQEEISASKADVIAQLNAVKVELEGELAQINATINTLKAKDLELDSKIADLQTYVDEKLQNTTDWVNATFATLEQYNQLVTEIATIKSQIETINQSITDLESRLNTKIKDDIAAAVSSLNAEIQQQVESITESYTEAIKSAKSELIAAYSESIKSAIADLDSSLKNWVGEQLSNYYTIAEIDAKLSAIQEEFNNSLNSQKAYLEELINQLSATLTKRISDNKTLIDALRDDVSELQSEFTFSFKDY